MSILSPVSVIQKTNAPKGLVIFFHGSGDTGEGVRQWIKWLIKEDLSFPHIRVLFPTAPMRPYTPLNGQKSNVWFDRLDINPAAEESIETVTSVCQVVTEFVKQEMDEHNIPINRVVLGGFSMGGALALTAAYKFLPHVAGVFALSSFLNNKTMLYDNIKTLQGKPCPLFMCHGARDTLVPLDWGRRTFEMLQKSGINGEFNVIQNTMHELKEKEIHQLKEWIFKVIPQQI